MGTPFVVSNFVKNQLCRKRVLVVLDDVNNSSQLEYLAGDHDRFGPGSRIIITTKDKQVLSNRAQVIYDVKKLDCDEALELFYFKAQGNDSLPTNYIEMSNQVVAYANGIPLALKVLSSFLCSKSKEEWASELRKLKVVPNMEIQNVLRLSYEGLDDREKDIFHDIACFFKRDDRDDVQSILNACGFFTNIGIRVLIDKSLITIMDNKLWMHDLLQEMGKEIIHQQSTKELGNSSRLWNDDVYHLLENNTVNSSISYGYLTQSERVIGYVHGVQLALKVLGSFLHSKSAEEWQSALDKLKRMIMKRMYFLILHVSSMDMV
ncbi:disease resistance protein RUN1-like [Ziziphus jujuba]|uniref:Disease resistance protein RUN1-like n=1 Tax=Ziziphus jujuba TaxID=326968 RepID=A0ABM3ZUJ4_ZIZJJ|nr:disease resistance protein RUN1-like [Ziziphus jujuba]